MNTEEVKLKRPEQWQMSKWWTDMFNYGGDDISNAFMMLAAIALAFPGMACVMMDTIVYPQVFVMQKWYDFKHRKDPKMMSEKYESALAAIDHLQESLDALIKKYPGRVLSALEKPLNYEEALFAIERLREATKRMTRFHPCTNIDLSKNDAMESSCHCETCVAEHALSCTSGF